ncbi:DUF3618 domain-containing protein [Microbacterium invictum]|uniref:DUF3618 domain-containing protein n=1 Tax=Microbacterium invictum TaxID=515415 RepID=A0ABZ0VC84_9MICO|nr:DUF3618 domain-containing protein [Microbacterium invictum]WQB70744.1 DUF3618 domain-containing protein [Microbacterium invictum]
MSDSPEAIRADIERTRRELGGDVDALADKVSPSKIMERQTNKVKGVVGSVRDRLMGAADDAGSTLAGAGDAVGSATHRVATKAEGNPLAVGLMAFAAGLLVASLVPASAKEKELADTVKDKAQPLVDEVTEVAKEAGSHLREPVKEAAAAVKESAIDSAGTVKDEATTAAAEVKGQADTSRQHLAG